MSVTASDADTDGNKRRLRARVARPRRGSKRVCHAGC